jgi:hypothetical protein
MRKFSAEPSTGQFPDPPGGDDSTGSGDGSTTRMLVKPVFTRGSDRRRKMLVRGGYLLAASCVAYLAMVLVSVFASPSARPVTDSSPGADPTTVQQVTPARPTQAPSPPPAPARVVRPAPAPVTRQPLPPPVTVAPSATLAPTASVKPTRKTKAPAASKTPKPTAAAPPAALTVP